MNSMESKLLGKVLIVDDDFTVCLLARETLEQAGFEVHAVDNGPDAIDLLETFTPDIILLDVLMPGMDGYLACQEIRKHPFGAAVPIVMMTGLDDFESIERAYHLGATDFISKPIHWLVLPHRVQYIVRSSRTYKELKQSEARLSHAQMIARLGNWEWDIVNDKLLWSKELFRMFAIDPLTFNGTFQAFLNATSPPDREMVQSAVDTAIATGRSLSIDHQILLPSGTERFVCTEAELQHDSAGRPCYMAGTIQDITERKLAEIKIRHLAYHDILTGLPNRALFSDRLTQALYRSERSAEKLAVLFFDLDDFKAINDTHGHRIGDLLLIEASRRLDEVTRAGDTLARLGGDEFTVFLHDIKSEENALLVANHHLNNLLAAFQIEDKQLFVSASVGIALFPDHGSSAEVLIKSADAAMYQAKQHGKSHVQLFTQTMSCKASERLSQQEDLRRALDNDEFVLHYQPRVNLLNGTWSGVEALVRWQHPDRGLILPLAFIPLAEETGLIMELGQWVLREATMQLHRWHLAGINLARVSVNVSPLQFRRQNLIEIVKSALSEATLCPQALEIEITESAMMNDMDQSIITLKQLRQLGVNISIDDFGTGYSSLSHLRSMPVDTLKVDRSFVTNAHASEEDAQILTAIIAMAHSLKLEIVAEGVECEIHETLLIAQRCREAQGFYYAEPMSAEALTSLLLEQTLPLAPMKYAILDLSQDICCLINGDPTTFGGDPLQLACRLLPGRPPACRGKASCEPVAPTSFS
ncbi:MAG: EAL domain-containing protein [Desulfuromonadaceae bacterium]|nr:EAL domain-containing protein [Desulfuromonadaceae bacterium]